MKAYLAEAFAEQNVAAELCDPANTVLLAVAPEGSAVGYAKLRRGPADAAVTGSRPIELERIYVDATAMGTGLGSALLDASIALARTEGYDTMWLGVWEHNPRAIEFYRRKQFTKVGTRVFVFGSSEQTDWLMVRNLAG